MNRQEIAAMLAMISSLDGRRAFGEVDVIAWEAVVGDLRFADAREAVISHYRENTQTLMPASLYGAVKKLRRDRIGRATPEIPAWIDPDDVSAALTFTREWYRIVGDGTPPEAATSLIEQQQPLRQVTRTPMPANAPTST